MLEAPLHPGDFRESVYRIEQTLEPWRHKVNPDVTWVFASIRHSLSPASKQAPLVGVVLHPLPGGLDAIERHVLDGWPLITEHEKSDEHEL